MMLRALTALPTRSSAAARLAGASARSLSSKIPTSVHGFDLEPYNNPPEQTPTEESKYKLGKHRSNALEMIHKHPVIEVEKEKAICDGGGGPLGHPIEYISLARPGVVESCKYCGLRFKSKAWEKYDVV